MIRAALLALAVCITGATSVAPVRTSTTMLVKMDSTQTNHLKAYGLVYSVLQRGQQVEWLLDHRGGAFLMELDSATVRDADTRGVSYESLSPASAQALHAEIAAGRAMSAILDQAPRVALFASAGPHPMDNPIELVLHYAGVPYSRVSDYEVLDGALSSFDLVFTEHEDFTGQHGKFYAAYHTFPWYRTEELTQQALAESLHFAKVPQLKGAVALALKEFVVRGGFLMGMCSATDTYDIALASIGVDIADSVYDGDAPDPDAQSKLDYSRTLAFQGFTLETDPYVFRFSDIDITQQAAIRGPNESFVLRDGSLTDDLFAAMLVQDHTRRVPVFLGMATGFRASRIKDGVRILDSVEYAETTRAVPPLHIPSRISTVRVAGYLCGTAGKGRFTFLGGHDPEDYQHMFGDPPTDLSKHPNSPGYRLILNNLLAAGARPTGRANK